MIELNYDEYNKVKEFIQQNQFETAYPESILSGQQEGRIWVDQKEHPQTVFVWHYCGMAYIFGNHDNKEFNDSLKTLMMNREKEEYKYLCIILGKNDPWNDTIESLFVNDTKLQSVERCFFEFSQKKYEQDHYVVEDGFEVVALNPENIPLLHGRVIPSYSFRTIEEFMEKGIGFGIRKISTGEMAGCAFASGIGDQKIDIGIEVHEEFRRRGFARVLAAKMVEWCLKNKRIPDWGCIEPNEGSKRTAMSVGFELQEKGLVYHYEK